MNKWAAAALFAMFLTISCGGPPPPVQPKVIRDSSEAGKKAGAAYERGDHELAIKLYSEALRLSRSVEDLEGTALNLVNLAAVYRTAGDRASSHETLQGLFRPEGLSYPDDILAGGAMIKALLLVDEGNLQAAFEWAERAGAYCSVSKCDVSGGILNLKARILLLRDRIQESLEASGEGLKESRRAGDMAEAANSIRLMADAHLASGRPDRSFELYGKALEIDKKLALPLKIALDLKGLGVSKSRQGEHAEAMGFFLRSLDVAISSGKRGVADEINALIDALPQDN
jgi:tetratricopeptide (TPR) repeat protein